MRAVTSRNEIVIYRVISPKTRIARPPSMRNWPKIFRARRGWPLSPQGVASLRDTSGRLSPAVA
jgi:hypothetical protein